MHTEVHNHVHIWERLPVKEWDKLFMLMLKSYSMTAKAEMEKKNVCLIVSNVQMKIAKFNTSLINKSHQNSNENNFGLPVPLDYSYS